LAAPNEKVDLVERFEHNQLEYKSSTYNEAQTRQEFIDPFFKALGCMSITSTGMQKLNSD
jgi:hypothetical protein